MSTPTRTPRHQRTRRGRPAAAGNPLRRPTSGGQVPFWERHRSLVPFLAVAAVIGAFALMMLLTALAGGATPFTR
jgi:hypothetical protein